MCWIALTNHESVRHIARGDKRVFKITRLDGRPYYMCCCDPYEKGKRMPSKPEWQTLPESGVESMGPEGYHCYDLSGTTCTVRSLLATFRKGKNPVLTFCRRFDSTKFQYGPHDAFVMSCIIPRGCGYYKNGHGEIVAESIVPEEFFTINEFISTCVGLQ